MKIRAAAAQKQQNTQGINQAGQSDANAGADLSLRQEFQAALDNLAGRGVTQHNLSQLSLTTFDSIASNHNQEKPQARERQLPTTADANTPELAGIRLERDTDDRPTSRNDNRDAQSNQDSDEPQAESNPTDAAAPDLKTVAAVESSAGTVVAQSRMEVTPTQIATPASVAESETPDIDPVAATQVVPEQIAAQVNSNSGKYDAATKGKSSSANAPIAASQNQDTTEATPSVDLANPHISGENLGKTASQRLDFQSGDSKGVSSRQPGDLSALALSAAINSTLSQRLAAATSSGAGEPNLNRNSSAITQLGKSDTPSTHIRSDLRGDFSRSELAKNAEQSVRQARFQPSKILERVESTLKEAARSRDGKTISLRLDPPDLGSVKVDVSIRDGALHARVTAENSQVAGVIREKAHELQSMLRKLGLAVEKVSVSVHDGMAGDQGKFSQAFADSGNYRSQNQEKPRDFNNFGSGSSIALTEQASLHAVTPEGKRQLEIDNGWVA